MVEPTFPDNSIDRLSKSALTAWLKCEELVLEWNKQAPTRKFYWAGRRSHYLGEYFITISCQRILDEKADHWIGNCLIQKQDEGHLDADAVLKRLGAFVWQRNCEGQRSIFDKRWASATEDERGLYSIASSSWLDTVHPAYQKQIQKAVDDIEAGKRSDDILLYPRKTMTEDWMWLLVFAKVVEHSSDGSAITMEGVSLPLVSDFLHEDTTALPSKAFYDNQLSVLEALDNSPAGLYTLSFCSETSQAVFEFVSEKFCEIVGLSSAEIYGSLEGAFRNIHPEDRLRWEALNAKVFKEKKDFDHTIRLVVDGVERWVRAVSLCKQSEEDKWIWSGYLVDVTAETSMAMAVSQSRKMYVKSVIDYIDKEHGRFSHSKFEQRFTELLKVLGEGSRLNISVSQGYFDNIRSVLP